MRSIFSAATQEAARLNRLDTYFIVAALAVLLLVTYLVVYTSLKFRDKGNGIEPKQESTNLRLEMLMIGGPTVLVVGFFFLTITTTSAILPPAGTTTPVVLITGHQWWWEFRYPGTNVQTANEVHLPVGQRLLVVGTSADVVHDWWVPSFGLKMDLIPGLRNHVWVTIKKPGIYEGACSEFCGQQHAWMRIRVVAQMPADYARWLQAAARPAVAAPSDSLARVGGALFAHYACSSCHQVRGTLAAGQQGPDLTHFGSRSTMLAGLLPNTPQNVTRWLTDPQAVKPGAHMPRFIFGRDSIQALTAYLTQLK
ncbi:cytochrome c oxidase subunit II [Hymenobacter baengnokdamensis]|uniref:cytochrome c oxidase subunit II n=1 Tax=Hymenobacter baengnokdamensis TaxID=2615203 RepID=UPI001244F0D7|nr:cytochrome c oxidase subunit II [Hymenobacter baengnokdamensis]